MIEYQQCDVHHTVTINPIFDDARHTYALLLFEIFLDGHHTMMDYL